MSILEFLLLIIISIIFWLKLTDIVCPIKVFWLLFIKRTIHENLF